MCRRLIHFVMVLAFCLTSAGEAANIIWVSDWYDELVDGMPDDHDWVDMLVANEYTVNNQEGSSFGTGYWRTLDADKIAALNAADLIIISRNSNSGDFASDDTERTEWNSITAPMILLSPYFSRGSRWTWVDNENLAGDGGTPLLEAVDPSHPIFYDVALDTKNQVEIYDQTVGTGTVSFYNSLDVGNGTVIATPVGQEWALIAEWETGEEFYDGAGQFAGGRRLLLCMGTREGVGYGRGEYNLTAEGEKILINSIEYMLGTLKRLKAYSPGPADGSLYPDTFVNLYWSAGDTADSHDVYFGESFDDVNDGTGDTFLGNQTATFIIIGFPGFPYPDGLVPGTTYYWRIDEVEADGATKHKGDVWDFMVPPKKAYEPAPPDGAKFIDRNADLTWSAGWGAKLHTVYFGETFDDVNSAADGPPAAGATYDPGTLDIGKTYYWRVDEFDGVNTYRGDVWKFTTLRPGGGLRGEYFVGTDLSGGAVISQVETEIDFNWGADAPGPPLQSDNFSARWTGELEVEFSETYTFYANTNDGVRLWINDQLIIDRWVDRRAPTEAKGKIDLIGGPRYPIVMEFYDAEGDAVAQLFWESASLPRQIIPQEAFNLPVRASGANPSNGSIDVRQTPILQWAAGEQTDSHQVYFGTDEEAVKNADSASPEYKGTKTLGSESFDPGKLDWDTTYYWRVDEVNNTNPDSPWAGSVWSFKTANFLIVDDFEDYDADENQIWYAWKDGLGYGVQGTDPYYPGNGTGSAVGDETTPSYTEETIVHGGGKSMPFFYDNNKQGFLNYSEAELTLTYPRDWTENNVNTLTIWFRGNPTGFLEEPAGTYTINASGVDIWGTADEFRFVYKQLSGAGTISAQVLSVENTNGWAKAGVMIRESLEPGAKFAAVYITPDNGCRYQGRLTPATDATSDTSVATAEQMAITAPYWVKIERDGFGNFNGYYSSDGVSWQAMTWNPQSISMPSNVYIGLAVTSHSANVMCEGKFSDVQTTGTVSPLVWNQEAIGADMASNDPEPMYVALNGNAVVYHDNPNASSIDDWTQWNIDLQAFADLGVTLTNVNTIALGFGDKNNPQAGGSGTVYFDDLRLYPPSPEPEAP